MSKKKGASEADVIKTLILHLGLDLNLKSLKRLMKSGVPFEEIPESEVPDLIQQEKTLEISNTPPIYLEYDYCIDYDDENEPVYDPALGPPAYESSAEILEVSYRYARNLGRIIQHVRELYEQGHLP